MLKPIDYELALTNIEGKCVIKKTISDDMARKFSTTNQNRLKHKLLSDYVNSQDKPPVLYPYYIVLRNGGFEVTTIKRDQEYIFATIDSEVYNSIIATVKKEFPVEREKEKLFFLE